MSKKSYTVEEASVSLHQVIDEVQKVVFGQERLVRNLVIAMLAKWHIILEWVPGLAKTLSIETLSKTLGLSFSRIQFTPDLLPSDITGSTIYNQAINEFVIKQWPIFANLVLADEINRAPAKVQSALLEAMAEKQVTIGDKRFELERPFVVMATQNPLEQEGTYSLPEAQLDRFLLKTIIRYPSEEDELRIMKEMTKAQLPKVQTLLHVEDVLAIQQTMHEITVSDAIYTYVKNIVFATRYPEQYGVWSLEWLIQFGASPRASLALIQCGKARAMLAWRWYVLPEDIKDLAHEVLQHRILLSFDAIADEVGVNEVIDTLLHTIPVVDA